jgi:GAF domain-containing protein
MAMANPDVELAAMFQLLADSMQAGRNVADAMDQLVEACTSCTSAVGANVLFSDTAGRLCIVASFSQGSIDIAEAQLRAGKGPTFRAVHSGKPLELAEIALTRGFWSAFAEKAEACGFHASKSIPMRFRDHTLGAVNLYFDQPGSLSNRDIAIAHALTNIAIIAIVQHDNISVRNIAKEQLETARAGWASIELAKRMLSDERGLSADEALSWLRSYARDNRVGLSEVARQVTNHDSFS